MRIDPKICARRRGRERPRSNRQLLFAGFALALLLSAFGRRRSAGGTYYERRSHGSESAIYKRKWRSHALLRNGRRGALGAGAWRRMVGALERQRVVKKYPSVCKAISRFLPPDRLGSGMTENPKDNNDLETFKAEVDHIYDFIRER